MLIMITALLDGIELLFFAITVSDIMNWRLRDILLNVQGSILVSKGHIKTGQAPGK